MKTALLITVSTIVFAAIADITNAQSIPNQLKFEPRYVPENSLFARKVLGYDNRNKEVIQDNHWQDTLGNYDYFDFSRRQIYPQYDRHY